MITKQTNTEKAADGYLIHPPFISDESAVRCFITQDNLHGTEVYSFQAWSTYSDATSIDRRLVAIFHVRPRATREQIITAGDAYHRETDEAARDWLQTFAESTGIDDPKYWAQCAFLTGFDSIAQAELFFAWYYWHPYNPCGARDISQR